ncbi:hypothetical protein [uncultured Campylobacter sp.]|uniref:hypothetical protein n=1 Tax=uncultured Campylobacter sp. TaxID=218934 RepID=UPI0028E98280|nr:hypothetical protein [uncultured Campylobacter sp.]
MLIYCALNAAFALLGLALCGSGFFGAGSFGAGSFGAGSFGVRALAWLLSLEVGFLGAFGAVYFSFRAYRNKIEDELRAGKYDEILRQSPKNSTDFMSGKTSANDTNSASHGGENRGDASGDEISYDKACSGEILKNESFSDLNSGAEISNAQNSEGAVNFTSGETRIENGNSRALYDESTAERAVNSADDEDTENFTAERDITAAGECDINSTESSRNETSAYDATALGYAADKFNMNGSAIYGELHSGINDKASDRSQGDIGARCDDLKSVASSNLGSGVDRSNHSDGTDSGNRGGDVDSSERSDGMSDFGGGIGGTRGGSKDDFDGAGGSTDDWDDERKRGEVRSNFAGAFFSPFKILSYAALVAAIYLLAKLSLLNPLAIILGVAIIPLGTMIVAFADKDAR